MLRVLLVMCLNLAHAKDLYSRLDNELLCRSLAAHDLRPRPRFLILKLVHGGSEFGVVADGAFRHAVLVGELLGGFGVARITTRKLSVGSSTFGLLREPVFLPAQVRRLIRGEVPAPERSASFVASSPSLNTFRPFA